MWNCQTQKLFSVEDAVVDTLAVASIPPFSGNGHNLNIIEAVEEFLAIPETTHMCSNERIWKVKANIVCGIVLFVVLHQTWRPLPPLKRLSLTFPFVSTMALHPKHFPTRAFELSFLPMHLYVQSRFPTSFDRSIFCVITMNLRSIFLFVTRVS